MARVDYWNHNVHYQPVILAAVPDHCRRALDVGSVTAVTCCGATPSSGPNLS
jgi:hypothetical protein